MRPALCRQVRCLARDPGRVEQQQLQGGGRQPQDGPGGQSGVRTQPSLHTAQDGAEYWDIVQHRIYPEGPYVYISAATSFLKGRVKGSWHRGKDTTSRYNRITFHSKIYWKTLYLPVCTQARRRYPGCSPSQDTLPTRSGR